MIKYKRLGELLTDAGLITKEQLAFALQVQLETGKKLGEILLDAGIINEKDIIGILKKQMGINSVELEKEEIDPDVPRLITENIARRHSLIPFSVRGNKVSIAIADPLDIVAIEDVQIFTGMDVETFIAPKSDIMEAIDRFYRKASTEQAMEDFKKEYQSESKESTAVDEETFLKINNAPLVRFVDSIILQAVNAKASDIHIEPFEKNVRIRFRVDGDLQEVIAPEKTSHAAIVTRIKIMGKMNIAERRIPQDGRVNYTVAARNVDMRISILPTAYGEKIVIRILDTSGVILTKEQLGFTESDLEVFNKIIQYPYGIILVTGPTGSGKTTTLYAILEEVNRIESNIITVEDPIEYRMDGVNQVQVNVKAGLTFAAGLRSILRQDPDIIMIGEIRDAETAQISVRAAITGHLVLSTIHTNDTASTVSRLLDMDIEPYLISSAVVGIIAQRLVKKICTECKISYPAPENEKLILNLPLDQEFTLYKGMGCTACGNTGYKGRTSIVEIMPVSRAIKNIIDSGGHSEDIRGQARQEGMKTLKENGVKMALKGITSVEQIVRNTYTLE